jgi:hypothetical protein
LNEDDLMPTDSSKPSDVAVLKRFKASVDAGKPGSMAGFMKNRNKLAPAMYNAGIRDGFTESQARAAMDKTPIHEYTEEHFRTAAEMMAAGDNKYREDIKDHMTDPATSAHFTTHSSQKTKDAWASTRRSLGL